MALLKGRFIRLENQRFLKGKKVDGSDKDILKINEDDKIEFAESPVLSEDPTAADQAARKGYVDAVGAAAQAHADEQVSQEASDRQAADSALDARVATLESSTSDRDYVDSKVLEEKTAREAADSAIDGRLDALEADPVTKAQVDAGDQASKDYADQKIAALVNSAPETLDTLKELADAIAAGETASQGLLTLIGQTDDKVDEEILNRQSADGVLDDKIDQEITDRQAGDAALDTRLDALEADPVTKTYVDTGLATKQNSLGTGTTAQYLRGDLTWQAISTSYPVAQMKYVAKHGVDASADGSQEKPYLTITAALASITDATPSKRYVIRIAAGAYTEASLPIKANVFLIGESKESVRITGAVSMAPDFNQASSQDCRSGASMVTFLSAADFNWATVTSPAGKLYFNEVVFASTVAMYGHNNAIAQAQFDSCILFGALTISGINVSVFTNNVCYSNITLNQHPNGGMASILAATGGYCGGTVRLNTSVDNFSRRCSAFLRNFWSENLIVDGVSSYADVDLVSQGKSSTQKLNNGQVIALTPRINHDLETQMLKPLANNTHNMGDWGKQWMFNFAYVHASAGTDMYLLSAMESYDPAGDSSGKGIFINSDAYGLKPNVSGGDIELETAATSGTGVRGKVKVKARELDVTSAKITNVAAGSAAGDAVNKSQLDAAIAAIPPVDLSGYDTKAEVDAKVDAAKQEILGGIPSATLDTIAEIAAALESEQSATGSILTTLGQHTTQLSTLESGLAQELLDRAAADTALQGEVDAVESGLAQELLDRAAANAALQSEVDALEQALADETAARVGVDQSLGSALNAADDRLNALEARPALRCQKQVFTISAQNLADGYVDCAFPAAPMSMTLYVGGLVHFEEEDYMLSEVSGVTRITFMGDLVVPSPAALVEGDKVRVQYMVDVPVESGGGGGGGGGGELLTPVANYGLMQPLNTPEDAFQNIMIGPGPLFPESSTVAVYRASDNAPVNCLTLMPQANGEAFLPVERQSFADPNGQSMMDVGDGQGPQPYVNIRIEITNTGGTATVYSDTKVIMP